MILKGEKYPTQYAFSTPHALSNTYIIRTEEWKLICKSDNDELYNLKEDPQELNNLIDLEKEKFVFLKKKLDSWKRQTEIIMPKNRQPLSEEARERLKSLGYIQ